VFGKVTSGMDVVRRSRPPRPAPVIGRRPVKMIKVTISE